MKSVSIIYEESHGNETDSDNNEKEPGVFDGEPFKNSMSTLLNAR